MFRIVHDATHPYRDAGLAAPLRLWVAPALCVLAAVWWARLLHPLGLALVAVAACAVLALAHRAVRPALALLGLLLLVSAGVAGARWWPPTPPAAARVAARVEEAGAAAIAEAVAAIQESAKRSVEARRADGESLRGVAADAGVVVYEAGTPVGWAGRHLIPTDPLWEREGIVEGPFHTVAYAVAVRGDRRAVATVVLDVVPPADQLARSVLGPVGQRDGAQLSLRLVTGDEPSGAIVRLGGQRAVLRAAIPPAAAVEAARAEQARVDALGLLALALLVAFVAYWRADAPRGGRIATLGLGALVVAVAPLSAASNATRLFDAATFYSALGGPFTASVGALALSSALALVAVLALRRARVAPRRRPVALAVALLLATTAPYVLRDLARGITMPPGGADATLWVAWELGLFLAAMTLLTAGVLVGQRALPRGRGLPLWVAPVLATLGAVAAPMLLEGNASWPSWYAWIWSASVAALVLARRSRAVLLPSAWVAACGAVALTWGASVRERVELAAADIEGLGAVDEGSLALLARFADDLVRAGPPRDRVALLRSYAGAELAAGAYPVALAHWGREGVDAQVLLGAAPQLVAVADIVAAARRAGEPLLQPLPPSPVASLILAVPHASGEVTSVVLSARSRLAAPQDRLPVVGIAEQSFDAVYELALRPEAPALDVARTPWERRGDHLHAEWSLPTATTGVVRVHAKVGFDALDALLPRGALVVLLNLVVVVVLWGADAAADGALLRWARARRRQWRRSYRLQLSIALFAFFVVPAGGFAIWSSRRLQVDDRATRELLLREYLRRAVLVTGPAGPAVVGIPSDVPQFLFREGRLVAASDPLQLAVAPIGRWLDPAVVRAIGDGEDLIAARPLRVGERQVLFGFRPLGGEVIVAVPALVGDAALDQRRRDLGILLVLTTLLGAIAALGLSGIAARRLARPIGSLRAAALAVAGGRRSDIALPDTAVEFTPVFQAFDTMARDLAESEAQLARAQRVFAWGEMARQIAHEIKNPLTPMRLGVQHVLRAWRDGREDFGAILEENTARVLTEIEHLDATARSFAQFGAPPEARAPVGRCDVAAVVRDVAALHGLGGEERVRWRLQGDAVPLLACARPAELREVLLNLADNARGAGAGHIIVTLEVADGAVRLLLTDDGTGIDPAVLPRVFEPHFSTSTSGSGLGLAISRRLVEEWGGSIRIESVVGAGTTVTLTLSAGASTP